MTLKTEKAKVAGVIEMQKERPMSSVARQKISIRNLSSGRPSTGIINSNHKTIDLSEPSGLVQLVDIRMQKLKKFNEMWARVEYLRRECDKTIQKTESFKK